VSAKASQRECVEVRDVPSSPRTGGAGLLVKPWTCRGDVSRSSSLLEFRPGRRSRGRGRPDLDV